MLGQRVNYRGARFGIILAVTITVVFGMVILLWAPEIFQMERTRYQLIQKYTGENIWCGLLVVTELYSLWHSWGELMV